jgi:hypothetical protein
LKVATFHLVFSNLAIRGSPMSPERRSGTRLAPRTARSPAVKPEFVEAG